MAAVPQKQYEPIQITAGDTLSWIRYFSDYPASAGWQLTYSIRGNGQQIDFSSTANGDSHVILVEAAVTATWLPAAYEMEGYAENIASALRERIYKNNLTISQNLEGSSGDTDTRTFAQKMLELTQKMLADALAHNVVESDVEGTRIKRMLEADLQKRYNYWLQIRGNEIKKENSQNGRSNGRNRLEVFVSPSGQSIGQFGALPPVWPFGGPQQ
jgi:hypothetical protein